MASASSPTPAAALQPRTASLVALPFAALVLACAHGRHESRALPLTKLRLYETGVGYFERAGTLGGAHGAGVPVPSGHLDDALESLVVLGADGSVQQVAFDSRQSPAVARARAGLPAEPDAEVRLHDVLVGLRGHDAIVRGGGKRVRGRIVDIIGVPEAGATSPDAASPVSLQAGATPNHTFVLMMTPRGGFRRIDVATITAVRPLDPALRQRFGAALDAAVALRSNARGMLDVAGRGEVRIGYLAEAPVWRASYRMVVGERNLAALQGWALVHNDTEEDWHDVALELVNGRPDAFLFPMAAPRYDRRELVVPERELSSVPQLLTTTADAMWGDFLDEGEVGTIGYGSGSGTGSGYGASFGGRSAKSPRVTMGGGTSDLVEVGNLAALATGTGQEARTVFAYDAAKHLELQAGRSAMVPLLSSKLEAELVTWVVDFTDGTARHAVRVANTTAQTLPEGTLAVYEGGGFAGEAILPRLKPSERRFLEIGDDPDTELEIEDRDVQEDIKLLVYDDGNLTEHYLRTTTLSLVVHNRSGRARALHIEVPAGSNTEIDGADRIDFDLDRGRPLAVFQVPAQTRTKPRRVTIREGLTRIHGFEAVTVGVLERYADSTALSVATRKFVGEALTRRRAQAEAQTRVSKLEADIETAKADLERLRGHLQALGEGGGDSERNPLVKRVIATEDELAKLRRELETAREELGRRETATRSSLEALATPAAAG